MVCNFLGRPLRWVIWALLLSATSVWSQSSSGDAPGPVGGAAGAPTPAPDLRLAVPRPVRAASNALGLGRQRLALVVGNGRMGAASVLDSASRDTQAVAAVLRAGGFVVMVREDLSAAELRDNLKEFHSRLQPSGVGFIYATGLALQVGGQNLLLGRDARLAPTLQAQGVPVSEMVDALLGGVGSPRWLVLDAAFAHPALAGAVPTGLAAPSLPPGVMAMFSSAPGALQSLPVVATPAAEPALAATPFARSLVAALATPRATGTAALRSVRRVVFDATQGQINPWLGGDTDESEEFAEAGLLDALLPRTPAEAALEAAKQGVQLAQRSAAARSGELSVAEVLQQSATTAPTRSTTPALSGDEADAPANKESSRMQPKSARPGMPEVPANSLAGQAGAATSALGSAASVAATVAGAVASTAATVAVASKTAEALVAVQAAGRAANMATSVVGNVAALATRSSPAAAAEEPVRSALQRMTALNAAAETAPVLPAPAVAAAAAATAATSATAPAALSAAPAVASAARVAQALATAPPAPASATPATPAPATPTTSPAAPRAAPTDGRTQRVGDRGERPVYRPRSNQFGYAEGDTFSYQVLDVWKGEPLGSHTLAIEEVLSDGQLLANGAQWQMDAQGRTTQTRHPDGSLQRFEPSQQLWWSKPQRGESREVLFKEIFQRADNSRGEVQWTGSASVGRLRKIDTPAGSFEVLPIESSGWFVETASNGESRTGKWSRNVWYAPSLGHPVAIDLEETDRLGKLLRRERTELTHVQSQRQNP